MRPALRIGLLLLPLALIAAGPPDQIPSLLANVRDGHEDVRRSACDALADLGPDAKSAVPDLLAALNDRTWRGRWSAAAALVHIAPTDPTVIHAIVGALGDPSNVAREEIAYSLERVYPRPTWAVPVLASQVKDKHAGYAAASTLAAFGPDAAAAVPSLIESVHSDDEDTRSHACHAIGRIGPAAKLAVPALAELLASADKRNRAMAASALCDLGGIAEGAAPALVRATQDGEIVVRIEAAFTLGRIGYAKSSSLPAFTPPLKDEDKSVRTAFALGAAGAKDPAGRGSISRLLKARYEPDLHVRSVAIDAAARTGSAGIPILVEALQSPNYRARSAAAYILSLIARDPVASHNPLAATAVRALIPLLTDPEPEVRGTVAVALMNFHSPDAVPALLTALKHESWDIRNSAALPLGEVRGGPQMRRSIVLALTEALTDENRRVRETAARSLGHFQSEASDAVPRLIACLSDRDEKEIELPPMAHPPTEDEKPQIEMMRDFLKHSNVAGAAATTLGLIGPASRAAVPALVEKISDKKKAEVWRDAIKTLGQIGPDAAAAIPALVNLLPDEPVCYDVFPALAKMGERGAAALVAALKDERLRIPAEQELGRTGRAAIPGLINALHDPDEAIRASAANALGDNGRRADAAVAELLKATEDSSSVVRARASEALKKIGAPGSAH